MDSQQTNHGWSHVFFSAIIYIIYEIVTEKVKINQ